MSFENLLMVMKYSFGKSARARKQLHCGRFGSTYVLRVFVRAITSLAFASQFRSFSPFVEGSVFEVFGNASVWLYVFTTCFFALDNK